MPEGYSYRYHKEHILLLCPNGDRIHCDSYTEAVEEAVEHRKEKGNDKCSV